MRHAAIGVALVVAAAAAGCGNDGGGGDGGPAPFVADPPAVYVAKVKNILTGLAPTDAEVAQVTADPKALAGLIDGWMQLPEYQQKMMVFFELAFQQTQINAVDFVDIIPPQGIGIGRPIPLLVQNVRESFARTVLQLTAQGRPLTDAFTTHQLMMTPPLMELYAFLDSRRVDDDAAISDNFVTGHPRQAITLGSAAVPLAQTLDPTNANFMHWTNPDIATQQYADPTCNAIDPITFRASSMALHTMMYGEIPNHTGTGGNCGNRAGTGMGSQFAAADFSAWKLVTIRAPLAGEAATVFYDARGLRTATELVLETPRVGFFSTPAFFANWPTNASNQMRATVNQALIVATGTAIDGQDLTAPSTTPGLNGDHSAPGTACFGCHQTLDPTRSILSSTYSWFYYPQTDPALRAQPGLFAFQGVVQPVHTIDDFALQLAHHPLVPQAWGQKLCYYANSAACDPLDPEFVRVLGVFGASGMSWNALVRELMASPITTNASKTETAAINGNVIAVSRRDHLCAALNNRLRFSDICQLDITVQRRAVTPLAQIVSGMPSDGYGRGAAIPVLPNEPTLFYRAGLENVCEQAAALVIDPARNTTQPGAMQWSSTQPDAAIADFVAIIMALTSSDPRAAQATAILKAHYTAALAQTTAKDALQSTFVAACLSPSFIGIGM